MNYILSPWDINDVSSLSKHANNKNITKYLRDGFPEPYTEENSKNYIDMCLSANPANSLLFAVDINGEAVGSIGIFKKSDIYRMQAEIGYWLGEPFWDNGIISNAVKDICKIAFNNMNIIRIEAEPFEHNTGSRRILEKNCFILEGIKKNSIVNNNTVYNSCIYALMK
jgi:ribosomal-protein-alanine N-acetyltransferase